MTIKPTTHRLAITLAGLGCAIAASQAALAQQRQGRVIEEVVVTAQKTQQSLQDVPISISALGGDFMQENNIGDLVEVSTYVPNVRVEFTSPSSPQVFIRGFGTNSFNPSFEPAVGLVSDEIFFGRAGYFTSSMYDLDRVEVLRGPQGTLFGKNTIAGVFNVASRRAPAEEGLEGKLSLKSENYGETRLEAGVGYRLSPELGFRLSVMDWQRDGRIENTLLERKEDDRDQTAFRIKLQWQPSDALSAELIADKSEMNVNFWPRQLMKLDSDTREYLENFDPQIEDDPFNFQTSFNHPGTMFQGTETLSLKTQYDFGEVGGLDSLETTLIAGASWLDVEQNQDLDVSPADLLILDEVDEYQQTSFEWRFNGRAASLFGLGSDVEFITGLYYFQSDFHIIADVILGQDIASYVVTKDAQQMLSGESNVPGNPLGGTLGGLIPPLTDVINETDYYRFDYVQDTEATALFGQVSWNINEQWVLTPGLRYNEETKLSTPTGTSVCTNKALLPCLTPTVIGANDYAPGTIERTERKLSPKVSLAYYINESVNVYASTAMGFKSGGVNAISFTGEQLEYEPEQAQSIELGFRSQLLDNTLKLNATLYRMDFDDLQVLAFNGLFFDVTNAAAAYSEGLEADIQWLTPYEPLSIDASLGYLRARYKDYQSAPAPISEGIGALQDLSGETLAFAPELSVTLIPSLEYQLGNFELKTSLTIQHRGEHYTDTDLDPNTRIPATTTLGANLSLGHALQGWSLAIGGKNLTDERTLNQVIDTAMFPGTYNPSQNPGRQVYASLNFSW
ncbi:TonB-dependent receptor [Spongiibacter sp. KMU-158]|uniref:TonB-dependent receptor n=1 Tax=Spongiibacter pelagi TaxID=2760804 RepID=A0A927GW64_9GAMM|nr:TonB-dependent receptor [Spongiibacter pelagi]MBD2859396.1 TonB-dependent receptor [Spongiibacter pelagi]